MNQIFKQEGTIKAALKKYKKQSGYYWEIKDEKNACDSCLICTQYKYNHNNIRELNGKFVHICLLKAPEFIDLGIELAFGLNRSCQFFNRRALG